MALDVDAVVSAARRCAAASELRTTYPDGPAGIADEEVWIPPETLDQFVAVLKQQPELVIFDEKMQQLGFTAQTVHLHTLARWFIRRAMEVGPAIEQQSKDNNDARNAAKVFMRYLPYL